MIGYETILPKANYAPWLLDDEFNKTYSQVKEFTMVDKYRLYELWKLTQQSAKLPFGSIIEIGAWRGGSGALIAQSAKNNSINENVYLCDTFKGVVKTGPKDTVYKPGMHSDTSLTVVKGLISMMKLDNVGILPGIFPDETGHFLENQKFRLCHIDVDVYQSAKDILNWIWDRMVPGGIIVYDDYGFSSCDGVTKHVNEIMNNKDKLIIHNLNGHAVIIKI